METSTPERGKDKNVKKRLSLHLPSAKERDDKIEKKEKNKEKGEKSDKSDKEKDLKEVHEAEANDKVYEKGTSEKRKRGLSFGSKTGLLSPKKERVEKPEKDKEVIMEEGGKGGAKTARTHTRSKSSISALLSPRSRDEKKPLKEEKEDNKEERKKEKEKEKEKKGREPPKTARESSHKRSVSTGAKEPRINDGKASSSSSIKRPSKATSLLSMGLSLRFALNVTVVDAFVDFFNDEVLKTEGLFRKAGANNRVTTLFELCGVPSLFKVNPQEDLLVVAEAFTKYLLAAPSPPIPFEHFESVLKLAALRSERFEKAEEQEVHKSLVAFLSSLAHPHFQVLERLIVLILKAEAFQKESKTSALDLATIFGPVILRPRKASGLSEEIPKVLNAGKAFILALYAHIDIFVDLEPPAPAHTQASLLPESASSLFEKDFVYHGLELGQLAVRLALVDGLPFGFNPFKDKSIPNSFKGSDLIATIKRLTGWNADDSRIVASLFALKRIVVSVSNESPSTIPDTALYILPGLELYRRFGVSIIDVRAAKEAVEREDIGTLTAIAREIESMNVFFPFHMGRQTMVHYACALGKANALKTLLKLGANVDVIDTQGSAPIHLAVLGGHLGIVAKLIKKGVKVNTLDTEGSTLLHYLSRLPTSPSLTKVIEIAVKAGANLNTKNFIGDTPLHFAASKGRTATVIQLCKLGANAAVANKFQCTPLELVVEAKDLQAAKALLEAGANPSAIASGGSGEGLALSRSIVDLAQASGNVALGQLLSDYHAQFSSTKGADNADELWAKLGTAERLVESPLVNVVTLVNPDAPSALSGLMSPRQFKWASLPKDAKARLNELAGLVDKPLGFNAPDWIQEFNLPKKPTANFSDVVLLAHSFSSRFAGRKYLTLMGEVIFGTEIEPIIINIALADKVDNEHFSLIWTVKESFTVFIPEELVRDRQPSKRVSRFLATYLEEKYSSLRVRIRLNIEIVKSKNKYDLENALIQTEMNEPQIPRKISVGVLYGKKGQSSEAEFFKNGHFLANPAYLDFLQLLGEQIELEGHKGYRGDLDVSQGHSTGTHSIYRKDENYEIMFHVATLLPSIEDEGDQQTIRKRFIGNAIVCVVFLDEGATFVAPIKAEITSVYIIVSPILFGSSTHYRVTVLRKSDVPIWRPELCAPSVIMHGPTMEAFMNSKIINGHLSALRGSNLAQRLTWKPRRYLYESLVTKFAGVVFLTPISMETYKNDGDGSKSDTVPLKLQPSAAPATAAPSALPDGAWKQKPAFVVQKLLRRRDTDRSLLAESPFAVDEETLAISTTIDATSMSSIFASSGVNLDDIIASAMGHTAPSRFSELNGQMLFSDSDTSDLDDVVLDVPMLPLASDDLTSAYDYLDPYSDSSSIIVTTDDLSLLDTPEKPLFQKPKLRTIASLSEIDYLSNHPRQGEEADQIEELPFEKTLLPTYLSLSEIVPKSTVSRMVTVKRFGIPKGERFFPLPILLVELMMAAGDAFGIDCVSLREEGTDAEIEEIAAIKQSTVLLALTREEEDEFS